MSIHAFGWNSRVELTRLHQPMCQEINTKGVSCIRQATFSWREKEKDVGSPVVLNLCKVHTVDAIGRWRKSNPDSAMLFINSEGNSYRVTDFSREIID